MLARSEKSKQAFVSSFVTKQLNTCNKEQRQRKSIKSR